MTFRSQRAPGPSSPAERLRELGVTAEVLREAVSNGQEASSRTTPNDPIILAGFLGWAKAVGYLRDLLGVEGWEACRDGGYETTVRPDKRIAIAVATGDGATGRLGIS